MPELTTVIGTVTVTKELARTQHHQYACDYTNHLVQPGTYEVTCRWERMYPSGVVFAQHIDVTYDSVITENYAPNLFGGVPFGDNTPDTTRKPGHFHAHLYAYQCPAELSAGAREVEWLGGVFTAAEGVEFEEQVFESEYTGRRVSSKPVYAEPAVTA